MSEAATIVFAFIAIFVIVLTIKGIRIVPERSVMMIERLGRFSRQLDPGLNLIVPVVDSPRLVPIRATIKDSMGQKTIRRRQHQSKRQLVKIDQVKQTRQCVSQSSYRGGSAPRMHTGQNTLPCLFDLVYLLQLPF